MFARRPLMALVACLVLAGCGGAGKLGPGDIGRVPAGLRRRGDVVIIDSDAADVSGVTALADAIQAMTSAAIAIPSSREVILRARAGAGEIAWLAIPTEELWAAASGASSPDDVMRHISTGFGDARSGRKPDVAAVRKSLMMVDADGLAIRSERGDLVIRIQMSRDLPMEDHFSLWADLLGRAAVASPGAQAYRLELAAGKLVVAKVVLCGRDAHLSANKPALLVDRLQLAF